MKTTNDVAEPKPIRTVEGYIQYYVDHVFCAWMCWSCGRRNSISNLPTNEPIPFIVECRRKHKSMILPMDTSKLPIPGKPPHYKVHKRYVNIKDGTEQAEHEKPTKQEELPAR